MNDHVSASLFNPVTAFPEFYTNPVITALGQRKAWTISDNDKMPVDLHALTTSGRVYGAHADNYHTALATLPELTTMIPQAANCAFRIETSLDHCLILDIEKTCPTDVADQLLLLSTHAYYTETSMSGKGYHLVMPMPANFDQFPNAQVKTALKHTHGWFEVLLHQWITFTRNPIPQQRLNDAYVRQGHAKRSWEDVYAELAAQARPATHSGLNLDPEELKPDDFTPVENNITEQAIPIITERFAQNYTKDVYDFDGDYSRWEFSRINVLTSMVVEQLSSLLLPLSMADPTISRTPRAEHVAYLVYKLATTIFDHRDKHDTTRNGLPFLYYRAVSCIEEGHWPELNQASTPPVDNTHTQGKQAHRLFGSTTTSSFTAPNPPLNTGL